jgi:hypothetical protein
MTNVICILPYVFKKKKDIKAEGNYFKSGDQWKRKEVQVNIIQV